MQLVDGDIKLFYPHGKKSILYTGKEVENKYGIKSKTIPDFKSLVGDKTDNIKGIAGIGEKTAKRLLFNFGSIESMLNNLNEVNPESLRVKIEKNQELLFKNLSIIKLDKDMDLPFNLEKFRITTSYKKKTMEILREVGIV